MECIIVQSFIKGIIMGTLCNFSELKNVIIHDASALERYNTKSSEHTLSTICFKNKSEIESDLLATIIAKSSRKSDVLLNDGEIFVLVMPATDKNGARHIFEEMHSTCKDVEKVDILSYPEDAFTSTEYYEKISKILNKIKGI
ncbi:MAG: hypothetical protein QG567_1710 [Campylobacterota bacterium]|nr:hypothetical protein [Campylobacterota bacterium]